MEQQLWYGMAFLAMLRGILHYSAYWPESAENDIVGCVTSQFE